MRSEQINSNTSTAALAIWLLAQLAALGLAASRLMLWARSPRSGEALALGMMLGAQIVASALLFPYLLRTWPRTLLVAMTAIPMAQFAAALTTAPPKVLFFGEIYVVCWLVALRICLPAFTTEWSRLFATGIAAVITLGGPVLFYLRAEFAGDASIAHDSLTIALAGPIVGAISQTLPDRSIAEWGIVGILFFVGGTRSLINLAHRKNSRQIIH